jgi:hypothetical protein
MCATFPIKPDRQTRALKSVLYAAVIASMVSGALTATLGDSTDGKRLHDANCVGCHDSSVYTRKTRSVNSLDALKRQLETCGHASNKDLTPIEKQHIIKYLNDAFYHLR